MSDFKFSSNNGLVLTQNQARLLEEIESIQYSFGQSFRPSFSSIWDLRDYVGYDVVLSDIGTFMISLEEEIQITVDEDARKKLESQKERINREDHAVLLGLFTRYDVVRQIPIIYLFPENIERLANSYPESYTVDNILAFVYIHEVMHAFFSSRNQYGFYEIPELEEAFAECAMLRFISKCGCLFETLYHEAEYNVKQKQNYKLTYHYGFGYELYIKSVDEGVTDLLIDNYRNISNRIQKNPTIASYIFYISIRDYSECYKLIKDIFSTPYPALNRPQNIVCGSNMVNNIVYAYTGNHIEQIPICFNGNGQSFKTPDGTSLKILLLTNSIDDMAYGIIKHMESGNIKGSRVVEFKTPYIINDDIYLQGEWTYMEPINPYKHSLMELLAKLNASGLKYYIFKNGMKGGYRLLGSVDEQGFIDKTPKRPVFCMGDKDNFKPEFKNGKWYIRQTDVKHRSIGFDEMIYIQSYDHRIIRDYIVYRVGDRWGSKLLKKYDTFYSPFSVQYENIGFKYTRVGLCALSISVFALENGILKCLSDNSNIQYYIHGLFFRNDKTWCFVDNCLTNNSADNEFLNNQSITQYESYYVNECGFMVRQNGKWGVLDAQIPCEYDDISYDFGLVVHKNGKKTRYIR